MSTTKIVGKWVIWGRPSPRNMTHLRLELIYVWQEMKNVWFYFKHYSAINLDLGLVRNVSKSSGPCWCPADVDVDASSPPENFPYSLACFAYISGRAMTQSKYNSYFMTLLFFWKLLSFFDVFKWEQIAGTCG